MAASKRPTPVTPLHATLMISNLPQRVEQIDFPEPYAPLWVKIWCNPSVRLLQDTKADTAVPAFLAQFVRDWNLVDEDGKRLAITSENVAELPTDVQGTLIAELQLRQYRPRTRPAPPTADGTANR